MAYARQLAWKKEHVAAALAQAGVTAPVAACVPSPRPLGYRNKSKLVYAEDATGRGVLGAYAPRSHRVVDLAGCRVAEPPLDDVAGVLRDLLARHQVRGYDERAGEGLLRYAILRVNHLGQVLVTLVTAADAFAGGEAIARELMATRPEVVGVVQNVNRSRGNVLYGDDERVLAGALQLHDRVGSVELRLSSTAFFQVNREVAARIYADLAEAAALTGTERVVDAYAGVGGIALTLARGAAEVVGIEEHPRAVADAQASAQLNHAFRARFVVGAVEAELAKLGAADVVVLNPPRRGCAPPVLRAAAALRPRLIAYVSCAPDTLARDLALLQNDGLRVRSVVPYDMLPQTAARRVARRDHARLIRSTSAGRSASRRSTSSALLSRPKEMRIPSGKPIARKTGDGSSDPELHAAPVDTARPSRSSACISSSPETPSNAT